MELKMARYRCSTMSNGSNERSEDPQEFHVLPSTPLTISQEQEIDEFWRRSQEDTENIVDFNNHILPMDHITEIIKANQGSIMSYDTPPFVTKLCELFIQELTICAWMCASSHGRRFIILESDIIEAINSKPCVFLNDVLQRHGINLDQASTFNSASKVQQETNFLVATTTLLGDDSMLDVKYKDGYSDLFMNDNNHHSCESSNLAAPDIVTPPMSLEEVVNGGYQNIVVQKCSETYDFAGGNKCNTVPTEDIVTSKSTLHKDIMASESTLHKLVNEDLQFSEDNVVPIINTQPDPLKLKNDEDLNNISANPSGSTKETK
ncbi:hypothetical protein BAE44_0013795 [Dichanthelium oligosanthes]|uniref:Transcription factor CBF/NF-Y/archaeal histone domain-containing protein n=1 Tax=Dichanthelium oligosanthes TaxID=888268 RepID=A0A1E5VJD6_9POAL|nr:hypothetical protein BAE44_0013795 [Dichanthelium oligosanthes]